MKMKISDFIFGVGSIARTAKKLVAIDFSTKQEYNEYMRKHPLADPKNHRVVPPTKKTVERQDASPKPSVMSVDDVKRMFGEDSEIKTYSLSNKVPAFSYKKGNNNKDTNYHLVIGGKEVAVGKSVDCFTSNQWAVLDSENNVNLFQNSHKVDSIPADKGKIQGIVDNVWIKDDFDSEKSYLYINGVKVSEAKDIRQKVSEEGVKSEGLVLIDGKEVNAGEYKDIVKSPKDWDEYVKKNGNPFSPSSQSAPSDRTLVDVLHGKGDAGKGNGASEYRFSDTETAEEIIRSNGGLSNDTLKELAGFKQGVSQRKEKKSISELKSDFIRGMSPSNYESQDDYEKERKRISDMSLEDFAVLLVVIMSDKKEEKEVKK